MAAHRALVAGRLETAYLVLRVTRHLLPSVQEHRRRNPIVGARLLIGIAMLGESLDVRLCGRFVDI